MLVELELIDNQGKVYIDPAKILAVYKIDDDFLGTFYQVDLIPEGKTYFDVVSIEDLLGKPSDKTVEFHALTLTDYQINMIKSRWESVNATMSQMKKFDAMSLQWKAGEEYSLTAEESKFLVEWANVVGTRYAYRKCLEILGEWDEDKQKPKNGEVASE